MVETTLAEQAPQQNWLRNIFVGPKGIRAGWSALIFISVIAGILLVGGIALRSVLKLDPAWADAAGEGLLLTAVMGATAIMAVIERRRFREYGYVDARKGIHALAGLASGFGAFSLLIGFIVVSGHLRLGPIESEPATLLAWAAIWGLAFAAVALAEESLFRGYLQCTLTRGFGYWAAAGVMALLFGLAHAPNAGENPLALLAAIFAGFMFTLLLRVTGSLWFPMGFHAAWDWAETYFFGAPDSGMPSQGHLFSYHGIGSALWNGGSAGPEGSVLIFPLIAIVIGICLFARRRFGLCKH